MDEPFVNNNYFSLNCLLRLEFWSSFTVSSFKVCNKIQKYFWSLKGANGREILQHALVEFIDRRVTAFASAL